MSKASLDCTVVGDICEEVGKFAPELAVAAILSHNLNRELQMTTRVPDRGTSEKRTPLWFFEELRSLRHRLIQRAGRFTNPQGNLTLTMSANESVKTGLLEFLEAAKEPL